MFALHSQAALLLKQASKGHRCVTVCASPLRGNLPMLNVRPQFR